MNKFNWNYPTTVWVGQDRVRDLVEACINLNIKKPLFVTDKDLINLPFIIQIISEIKVKLKELNIENFFINIGGEIRVEGMKNNNFWKIGIENPLPNQLGIFKPFEIKQSLSIATSGNYRNPGHIVGIEGSKIDQNVLSISVMDKKSTAYADALATGLFALGNVDLIKNNIRDNGIPALFIYKGDEKIQSFESKQWKELLQ